ncbi:chromosome segregation protein SMC [Thermosipho melanesiensis]|uniref:Chromosome partition protein Smc n=1 Tax=Thermosipho melanesiensis TaxID=46541 RepID=A0ABM6GEI8_9BACT|nr:chromosome segregation protein SMC [Thermosipho melanesiensis]OOC36764.1 chromosome segregation protein SMC [Thermosipho melanesiensis]OOC38465.1 chromosome segregation protein SMC [Thermosipho melanesiensis]OOC38927.1 chromosome segregation protein SMC [Thermosipho melanesiensis]OOC41565.1 chromosome segregation protein SMC [Thermosipho melanesiensis]
MLLKGIFLKGFKSFGKPTKIPISPNITAIVGPNGSGKSNIVEAIQWVLGEHSLKNLRASEKFDIIFKGSKKLSSSRSAFVELSFNFNGEEYKIARELTSSGENTYYINGEKARLKDITALFGANGMVSIIGQGKIDKIAMSTPDELKKIFEDAAGTSIYIERKKEALSKLAGTETNIERIKDVIYEIEKNKKSLYIKVKKAEKFKEYSQKLEEIKIRYFGGIYYFEKKKLESLDKKHKNLKALLKTKLKSLAETESRWNILREEFNKINKKMENFTSLLETQKIRQNQLLELKNSYTDRLNDLKNIYVEKMTKIDSLKDELKRIKDREQEISLIFDSLILEINKQETELSKIEEERNTLLSKYSTKEMEYLKKKNEYDEIEKNIHKLENEKKSLYNSVNDLKERISMIKEQLEIKYERKKDLDKEIKELSENAEKYDQKTKSLLEEIKTIKEKTDSLNQEREYLKENLEKLIHRKKEIQSEISIIKKNISEYQGFSFAIKKIFENKEKFPGIIDVVANIIDVDKKYVEAIEALLGGRMQHIVVENSEVAKKILQFAKEQKIGRITIIPLDLIRIFSKNSILPKNAIFAKNIVTIKVDEKEKLLNFLFGNDIIVENIDLAVEIKKKYDFRIATLDGELISNSGTITGGKSEHISPLSRKKQLEKLKEELENIFQLEEKTSAKISQLKDEINELRKYNEVINSEFLEINSKSSSAKRMLQELVKSQNELNKEITNLEKILSNTTLRLSGVEERINIIDDEIKNSTYLLKTLKLTLENTNKEMYEDKEKIEKINESYLELQSNLRGLNERKIQYEGELKRLSNRKDEIEIEISTITNETKYEKEKIEELENSIEEIEKELKTLKEETEALFKNMNEDKDGKNNKLKELETLESEMEKLRTETEELREEIHSTELELQKVRLKIENIDEKYRKEVKLSSEEIDMLKKEMETIETKLKYIGPVDFEAEEEYQEVSQKLETLEKQKKDLEDAKQKIIELIEKTDEEATQIFMNTFNIIKKTFKNYIKELFFGGKGDIRLLDKENILESGIEIIITKGDGRSQKLQLLSGGEKALVGLALLMSLLQAQPSAFYVLDEPDAPLDEFNAERFKMLLKNSKAQIIIITHKKIVMEAADIMVGITKTDDISTIVPVRMEEVV